MRKLRTTAVADETILDILSYSEETFGSLAADRYQALIVSALDDIATGASTSLVRWLRYGSRRLGLYHIRHSRTASAAGSRVKRPRHLVFFEVTADEIIVLGLVHETMDRPRALRRLLDPAAEPEAG
ncbi:type II toxin-antitoxin system RelE/ParE family toxin [Caenispirillum bisanense]|uniref:Toxin ParE1/3/4 n=1 Tax=Caenispirillum bisanense TaxID=414052 RepID=A0A286G1K6_9PROT|nr:type II toxin-antitoxin system RelE/ParE family toxin [Caenispirillum bisanense]SOD89405.1 toxin ParE1/3/4 [Caenispirillum bisanense]